MPFFASGAPGRRVLACLFLFSIIFNSPLFSQDNSPAAATDDEEADLVVTATRFREDSLLAPNFVTAITGEDIARSVADRLSQVLAVTAGAATSPQGQKGGLEGVWLRGANPKRVLVLLDGVPTNNALEGQMDLSLIPPDFIERIEVVQGGLSLLWGSNAVGGVVNLIPKKGQKLGTFFSGLITATSYLPQEYGPAGATLPPDAAALFDGGRAALSFGHDAGAFSLFLSGAFDYARNEYYYADSGALARRVNSGLLGGSGFIGLTFPWASGSCGLWGILSARDLGVPSAVTSPTPDAGQRDERLQVAASFQETRFLSDFLTLDAKLSVTRQHRFVEFPSYFYSEDNTLTAVFAEVSQKASVLDVLSFVYGGSIAFDLLQGDPMGERSRVSGSLFLSAPVGVEGEWRLYPAVRLDLSSDYGSELTYGLGLAGKLTEASSLKVSLAKSFRAPNFLELYYPGFSNPALRPEHGWHADLGYALKARGVALETALFVRLMSDEIVNTVTGPENLSQSFYPGWVTRASVEPWENFFIDAAYTFLYSFDLGSGRTFADDRRVPLVPVHEANLSLSYKSEATVVRLSASFRGECFNYTYTAALPPHLILNAGFRRKVAEFLFLSAALENILNTQYQMVDGYPMPGITLRWGMEFKF